MKLIIRKSFNIEAYIFFFSFFPSSLLKLLTFKMRVHLGSWIIWVKMRKSILKPHLQNYERYDMNSVLTSLGIISWGYGIQLLLLTFWKSCYGLFMKLLEKFRLLLINFSQQVLFCLFLIFWFSIWIIKDYSILKIFTFFTSFQFLWRTRRWKSYDNI